MSEQQALDALAEAARKRARQPTGKRQEVRHYPCNRCPAGTFHLTAQPIRHETRAPVPGHQLLRVEGRAAATCECGEVSVYVLADWPARRQWYRDHLNGVRARQQETS